MNTAEELLTNLELKEMDGSLLGFAIVSFVEKIDSINNARVYEAMQLASYLHRHDTRANRGNLPRDNYITHPYRNTLRVLRYGCVDENIIIACILHDTVEDHPKDLARLFYGEVGLDEEHAKQLALAYIADRFGFEVARLVNAVSNPILPKTLTKEEKRVLYAEHVKEIIRDPKVFVVKFSDFVDNAVGLYHNSGSPEMVAHLSKKYIQLVGAIRRRLHHHPELIPVSESGLAEMKRHLNIGETRLKKLIADD